VRVEDAPPNKGDGVMSFDDGVLLNDVWLIIPTGGEIFVVLF
jgi:hypothetical protein